MSRVGDVIQVYSVKMGGLSARGKNSEKDVEARNSNMGKETDTTVFSRRDNLRKSDRSDSLIKNRSYLKQKGSGNESYIFHLDQSGQLDLDKSVYSNSNRNIQVMPDSNKTNLNLSVQQGTNLQNGFDFPLHTFQEKSIRGKSVSDHTEPGIRRRENDGNLNYSRNEDAIGDDEPLFPIIVNKRELLNNEKGNNRNHHYKDRSVSNQRNARTTANQDLEKHNSEEAMEKNRGKKTLKGKQNSSIQVPKNGKIKGKRGSSVEPRTLKEKKSMDNEQLRTPKPDKTKVNLRQILQQLASYLDDNDNNQSIEAPEGREDEKQTENSKLNSKKSQNKHVPRNPSQKPKVK